MQLKANDALHITTCEVSVISSWKVAVSQEPRTQQVTHLIVRTYGLHYEIIRLYICMTLVLIRLRTTKRTITDYEFKSTGATEFFFKNYNFLKIGKSLLALFEKSSSQPEYM
jgi:hypothetical protein